MIKYMVVAAYLTSGVLLGDATDAWSVKCHGKHMRHFETWPAHVIFALIVPGLMPVAVVGTFFMDKPICETGYEEK